MVRGTPVLVLLMLDFLYRLWLSVWNISPVLVAVIAFGMNFAAYSAEISELESRGWIKVVTEAGIS